MSAFDIPKGLQGALGIREGQMMRRQFAFDEPITAVRLARENPTEFLSDQMRRGEVIRRREHGWDDDPSGLF